jgi:hypothetical protein
VRAAVEAMKMAGAVEPSRSAAVGGNGGRCTGQFTVSSVELLTRGSCGGSLMRRGGAEGKQGNGVDHTASGASASEPSSVY